MTFIQRNKYTLFPALIFALLFSLIIHAARIPEWEVVLSFLITFLLIYVLLKIFFVITFWLKGLNSKMKKNKPSMRQKMVLLLFWILISAGLLFGLYMVFII